MKNYIVSQKGIAPIVIILIVVGVLILGFFVTYLTSNIAGGVSLLFGWTGMKYLNQLGFPFPWHTEECPNPPEFPAVPTGCIEGFNLIALILDIILYSLVLFLFSVFFWKKLTKKH